MVTEIFNAIRDKETITAGGFWCEGCLVARPTESQSRDPRYCQGCHDLLNQEASITGSKTFWVPCQKAIETPRVAENPVTKLSDIPIPTPTNSVEVMLHAKNKGGRPSKPSGEPVTRMTEYRRRQKEIQGVLV